MNHSSWSVQYRPRTINHKVLNNTYSAEGNTGKRFNREREELKISFISISFKKSEKIRGVLPGIGTRPLFRNLQINRDYSSVLKIMSIQLNHSVKRGNPLEIFQWTSQNSNKSLVCHSVWSSLTPHHLLIFLLSYFVEFYEWTILSARPRSSAPNPVAGRSNSLALEIYRLSIQQPSGSPKKSVKIRIGFLNVHFDNLSLANLHKKFVTWVILFFYLLLLFNLEIQLNLKPDISIHDDDDGQSVCSKFFSFQV